MLKISAKYFPCNTLKKYQWLHTIQTRYLVQADLSRSCCALKIWRQLFSSGRPTTNRHMHPANLQNRSSLHKALMHFCFPSIRWQAPAQSHDVHERLMRQVILNAPFESPSIDLYALIQSYPV